MTAQLSQVVRCLHRSPSTRANTIAVPAWKALWGKECVATVVDITLTSRAPKYSLILELDRKIRDMELPKYAMDEPPKNASMSETMKHFMPINYRELSEYPYCLEANAMI